MQFDKCHSSHWLWLTSINAPVATRYNLIKIVASFSPNVVIVCINYDDKNRFEFNLCILNKHKSWHLFLMENFYASLLFSSKDAPIPDDSGKELATLNDVLMSMRGS